MCDPLGLVIYIGLLLLSIFVVHSAKRIKVLSWILLLIIVIAAALRGTAGVDTPLYILRFHNSNDFAIPLIEPLLPFLMNVVNFLGGNFMVFSLVFGLILSFLYYKIFSCYTNAVYFGVSVFPVIFIDSLYNGIRVGLAYPLIILALADKSFVRLLLASLFHISSIVVLPFLFKARKKSLLLIAPLLTLFLGILDLETMAPDRYVSKVEKYSQLGTANIYSGISDSAALLVSLIIFSFIKGFSKIQRLRFIFFTFLIILTIHVFVTSEYVFMLRVTRLLVICVFGLIIQQGASLNKKALMFSAVFGFFYIANYIRQIMETCSYENGFLPLTY